MPPVALRLPAVHLVAGAAQPVDVVEAIGGEPALRPDAGGGVTECSMRTSRKSALRFGVTSGGPLELRHYDKCRPGMLSPQDLANRGSENWTMHMPVFSSAQLLTGRTHDQIHGPNKICSAVAGNRQQRGLGIKDRPTHGLS